MKLFKRNKKTKGPVKNRVRTSQKEEPKTEHRLRTIPVFSNVRAFLTGRFLIQQSTVKAMPYLGLWALIAIFYIANTNQAEKKIQDIERLQKELKELRFEQISTKSRLMHFSKQSEVARRLEETGIKESVEPPVKLIINNVNE